MRMHFVDINGPLICDFESYQWLIDKKTWDGNLHDMQQQLSHYKIQTPQRQLEMDSAPTLFQIAPKF